MHRLNRSDPPPTLRQYLENHVLPVRGASRGVSPGSRVAEATSNFGRGRGPLDRSGDPTEVEAFVSAAGFRELVEPASFAVPVGPGSVFVTADDAGIVELTFGLAL